MSAEKVRAERKRLGLSAARVARILGVSKRTIWRWEAGHTRVHPVYLERLERMQMGEVWLNGSR